MILFFLCLENSRSSTLHFPIPQTPWTFSHRTLDQHMLRMIRSPLAINGFKLYSICSRLLHLYNFRIHSLFTLIFCFALEGFTSDDSKWLLLIQCLSVTPDSARWTKKDWWLKAFYIWNMHSISLSYLSKPPRRWILDVDYFFLFCGCVHASLCLWILSIML